MGIQQKLRTRLRRFLGENDGFTLPAPDGAAHLRFLARVGAQCDISGTVEFGGDNVIARGVHLAHGVQLGYASTLSEGCWLRGPVTFGNYCQMGPRVCLQSADHGLTHLTPYSSWGLFDGDLKKFTNALDIKVGHGVWCGYGAIILKGVSIGNGAVVGAGAVVTRDVPAYAIAVGTPARVVGQRFDDELCALLESSQWWTRTSRELTPFRAAFEADFKDNPALARTLLEPLIAAGTGSITGKLHAHHGRSRRGRPATDD